MELVCDHEPEGRMILVVSQLCGGVQFGEERNDLVAGQRQTPERSDGRAEVSGEVIRVQPRSPSTHEMFLLDR